MTGGAIETLEEVLSLMDECAAKLRSLHNPRIDAYCLADFEGKDGGWLGTFARDYIETELQQARRELEGGEAEAECARDVANGGGS